MKRRFFLSVLFAALVQLSVVAACAQATRVVTKTRLQVLFGDLETQWMKAVQQKNGVALDQLLGEDFEVWSPIPPGSPTPREDWQASAFTRRPQSFRIEQMSVRAVSPTIAIASFRLSQTFGDSKTSKTESHFVVDVWISSGHGDDWKCSDRYISQVADGADSAKRDVKPTGKE